MRQARRGLGGVYQRGGVWWIRYSYRGQKVRETSGSANRNDAVRLLKKRLGEMGQGRLIGPDAERVTLGDLKRMVLDDYSLRGNRSGVRAEQCFAHVVGHFGEAARALDMTTDTLVSYAKDRQEQGTSPATVKMELALLRRGFNLAVRAGRLPQRPAFPAIEARNRRTGFFEEAEFRAVAEHLDADVRPLAEFLFLTGWRKSEALSLEWRNVDFAAGVLRIEDSKNGEPRTLPFRALPELAAVMERQAERAKGVSDRIVPTVFFRSDSGTPIRDFRRAWVTACRAAGVPGRLVHDFRRSAARRLSRAGVPEGVIMGLCGWKTRSVFDRYRIVNEADLADGLATLAATRPAAKTPVAKVVQMRTGTERAQNGHNDGRPLDAVCR